MAGSGLGQPCFLQELERAILDEEGSMALGESMPDRKSQTLLRSVGERLRLQQCSRLGGPRTFLRYVGPALRSRLALG